MNWDVFDYHDEIEIDDSDFVKEWLNQHKLFAKYAEACTEARKIRDEAHEVLKVRRSKIIREYKLNTPSATGPQIEAYYRTHKKHIKLKNELIEAEYNCSQLENAVSAFRMRKHSLERLHDLWMANYYSEPQAKRTSNKFVDKIVKTETKSKIAKKMKSKRTK